ncbi:hypothetical protein [Chitinophaga caseinilytica]|uniref:hypothetical protein n=1 Tax=Chitinophaga caseinilytica TaxID=2267521 RepID=UPI003C3037D0
MNKLILKYSLITLAGLLVQWWLFFFAPFAIPERIPSTPINIHGVFLIGYLVLILILFQKRLLRAAPDRGIGYLTLQGALMAFWAELAFQLIRMPTLVAETFGERVYYCGRGTIMVSAFAAVLSFLVAFQLKTKRTGWLILLIIGVLLLVALLKQVFPGLWP